jgi:hypothetical protein
VRNVWLIWCGNWLCGSRGLINISLKPLFINGFIPVK